MSLAFAAMIGWCGTKWPGWWRGPPRPDPDPEPWWRSWLSGIVGAIGGVVAVIVFGPLLRDAGLVEMGAVAFFGGVFLGSLSESLQGIGSQPTH